MTALGDWLKDCGLRVDDADVPFGRTTPWYGVRKIVVHHTGGSCDPVKERQEAAYIRTGKDSPPNAQLFLGQSSTVWVCCRPRGGEPEPGRASHMGEGGPFAGISKDRGNEVCLGIEVQCDGSHPLSTHRDVYDTLLLLCAALCERYGLGPADVIGHREYAPGRKPDPKDDMDVVREGVARAMTGGHDDDCGGCRMFMVQVKGTKTVWQVGCSGRWPVTDPESRDGMLPAMAGGKVLEVTADQLARIPLVAGTRGFAGGGLGGE